MGRAGIRRRKRRRPLEKLPGDAGWPGDDTPPVMWPAAGSGFEASPFSPAGRAQGLWRMARGAAYGRRRGVHHVPISGVGVLVGSAIVVGAVLAAALIGRLLAPW